MAPSVSRVPKQPDSHRAGQRLDVETRLRGILAALRDAEGSRPAIPDDDWIWWQDHINNVRKLAVEIYDTVIALGYPPEGEA
jgi:hypothetical protein